MDNVTEIKNEQLIWRKTHSRKNRIRGEIAV